MSHKGALGLGLLCLFLGNTFSQDLVFGCIPSNGPPYFLGSLSEPQGGIFYDLAQAAAKKLGVRARFVEIPRGRLEEMLHKGVFNIIPVFHPTWAAAPERLIFSPPLVPEKNILLTLPGRAERIKIPDDLGGMVIGGIRSYYYSPVFQDGVDRGAYLREDVAEHRQNFEKVLLGRIDAFIIPDLIAGYELKLHTRYRLLETAPLILSDHHIHWAFSRKQPEWAARVSKILQELLDQGEIPRILSKYR